MTYMFDQVWSTDFARTGSLNSQPRKPFLDELLPKSEFKLEIFARRYVFA